MKRTRSKTKILKDRPPSRNGRLVHNNDPAQSIYKLTTNDGSTFLQPEGITNEILPPWYCGRCGHDMGYTALSGRCVRCNPPTSNDEPNQDPLGLRLNVGNGRPVQSPQPMPIRNIMQGMAGAKTLDEARHWNHELRTLNHTMTQNLLMTRATWMFEHMLDPRGRDLFRECGYPLQISPQMYREMYDRDGTAGRVVDLLPEESWENPPEVYENEDEEAEETDFEKDWKGMVEEHNLYHYLERVDKLSGIGSFGLLLLGLDDGKPLNQPVDSIDERTGKPKGTPKETKLLYMRAFDESLVHVGRWNTDQTTGRYAQPEIYLVRFLDYSVVPIGQTVTDVITHMVHWSRVVHIADNRKSSEVFGVPRMQRVFNRLLDLRKLYGGSAEMFWKGGFPGIGFEVLPELADAEIDQNATRQQMEEYFSGLRRYFAVAGMTIKTLNPNIEKPKEHIEAQQQNIALSIGVPWRVWMGSEVAVKAGEQDSDAWDVRLQRRKNQYLTPMVVKPVANRFVALGVVRTPKVTPKVHWASSSVPTEKDKAAIATALSAAIAAYMNSGGDQLFAPLDFMINVLGIDKKAAEKIVDNAQDHIQEQQMQQTAGGLPSSEDLVNALGMTPEDADAVLQAIQNLMVQKAQQEQLSEQGVQGGQSYSPPSAKSEDASGGVSGGVSGGTGSAGSSGGSGGEGAVPWSLGGSPKGSA